MPGINSISAPPKRLCLLLAAIGSVLGLSGPLLFPHSEAVIIDWQISQAGKVPASPAIVVIELEPNGPFACGKNYWNHLALADMLTALSEAKASVVSTLIPLNGPNAPQCGGIEGDAQLLEVILQDNFVIPAKSTTMFTRSAKAVGHTDLGLDIDYVLRQMPSTIRKANRTLPPWGYVVSQTHKQQTAQDKQAEPNTSNAPGWIRWSDQTYTKFSDAQIRSIKSAGISALQNIVQDKIVVLLPKDQNGFRIQTPFGSYAIPEPYAHLEILQSALSGNTFKPVSTVFLVMVISLLAWGNTIMLLSNPPRTAVINIIALGTLYGTLMWAVLKTVGILLPVLAPFLTVSCTTLLTGGWNLWTKRSQAQSLLRRMEQQLEEMKDTLLVKEIHTATLARQLQNPTQTRESEAGHMPVTPKSHEGARNQWRESQKEVDHLRRRLREMEAQVFTLRQKQSPYFSEAKTIVAAGMIDLQQQCRNVGIVTRDPQILTMFTDLKKAAKTSSPILITGETGTGKEIFARAIHSLSSQASGPLIAVNIAAIRPELFESELFGHARGAYTGAVGAKGFVEAAANGTLFLDEIGEIPIQIQAKLLRLLEEGTYYRVGEARNRTTNLRILAATNRNLWQDTQEGRFRSDLYFRLTTFSFHLPPLRERISEDRRLLAQFFIQDMTQQLGREEIRLSQGAMEAIRSAQWPGNIRELKHVLTQAATLTEDGLITEKNLKLKSNPMHPGPRKEFAHRTNQEGLVHSKGSGSGCDDSTVLAILREQQFDIQATAKVLQWDRSTVTQRLKGLGFQALVRHHGNLEAAAQELAAGEASIALRVQGKLRDYYRNLIPTHLAPETMEAALADCRRRMKNLPDRYFTAVKTLLHWSLKTESGP